MASALGPVRDLEGRAAQLSQLLLALTQQGHAARQMALQMLLANGEDRTERLKETERIGAPVAQFVAVAAQVAAWVADVQAFAGVEIAKEHARALPPKGKP